MVPTARKSTYTCDRFREQASCPSAGLHTNDDHKREGSGSRACPADTESVIEQPSSNRCDCAAERDREAVRSGSPASTMPATQCIRATSSCFPGKRCHSPIAKDLVKRIGRVLYRSSEPGIARAARSSAFLTHSHSACAPAAAVQHSVWCESRPQIASETAHNSRAHCFPIGARDNVTMPVCS